MSYLRRIALLVATGAAMLAIAYFGMRRLRSPRETTMVRSSARATGGRLASTPGVAVLATGVGDTHAPALVIDHDSVYVSACDPKSFNCIRFQLLAIARSSGERRVLGTNLMEPKSLIASDRDLYWIDTSYQHVMSMPKTGGTPYNVVPAEAHSRALVLEGERLVILEDDKLTRTLVTGTVQAELIARLPESGYELVADARAYFVLTRKDYEQKVLRVDRETGKVQELAVASIKNSANSLTQDAEFLFWANEACVERLSKTGGSPQRVVCVPGARRTTGAKVRGKDLFLVTSDTGLLLQGKTTGEPIAPILTLPEPGPPIVFAEDPEGIVVLVDTVLGKLTR